MFKQHTKVAVAFISYKNKGVDSASCDPALTEPYQVRDKKIDFGFNVR